LQVFYYKTFFIFAEISIVFDFIAIFWTKYVKTPGKFQKLPKTCWTFLEIHGIIKFQTKMMPE
jgi:hypothetical protein